ncbi:MAG: hypothetical protein HYY22_01195 [Thaumarchaeota archaeon]|nr:hypothetical protein [Nitrososphaerota archaeon]
MCATLAASNAARLLLDADFLLKSAEPDLYDWCMNVSDADIGKLSDKEVGTFMSKMDYPRVVTSLSLLHHSMQEVGKAGLAFEYIMSRKDLDYDKDYYKRFMNHDERIKAAVKLMKLLKIWVNQLDNVYQDLESLRRATLYVDYDPNLGVWVDPGSLGFPMKAGSFYSDRVFTTLFECLSGVKSKESEDLANLGLARERLMVFVYCFGLRNLLKRIIIGLGEYCAELLKDPQVKRETSKSIGLATYLKIPDDTPENLRRYELLHRLERLLDLLSPEAVDKFSAEVRRRFAESEQQDGTSS